jgi:hypothetical protein
MEMIVLKGHLLVEQLLTALLSHHCHTSAALRDANLRFYQKMHLVKAMISPLFPDECWQWVELINQLRNDFAHELEPPNSNNAWKRCAQPSSRIGGLRQMNFNPNSTPTKTE